MLLESSRKGGSGDRKGRPLVTERVRNYAR